MSPFQVKYPGLTDPCSYFLPDSHLNCHNDFPHEKSIGKAESRDLLLIKALSFHIVIATLYREEPSGI